MHGIAKKRTYHMQRKQKCALENLQMSPVILRVTVTFGGHSKPQGGTTMKLKSAL